MALTLGLIFQSAEASERRTFPLIEDPLQGPVIAIQVNGVESTAIIDTAATIAMIDDKYLAADQPFVPEVGVTHVLGLGGLREYPVTEISDLSIGTRSWRDMRVAVNTSDQFPVRHGIVPLSLFQSSIVDFEFSRARIQVYDGRPKRVRRATASTIKYDDHQRLVFIPIEINDVSGFALIDTGAVRSFVNPAFARQARAVPDPFEQEQLKGSDLSRQTAHLHTFRDFRFGDFRIAKSKLPVLDTDLFEELGYGDAPMMVMGMDFLRHFRLQVDQKRQRVTFVHSGSIRRRSPVQVRSHAFQ
ncbi:MAG: aspartyl protease family protein [Henriciella sp.]